MELGTADWGRRLGLALAVSGVVVLWWWRIGEFRRRCDDCGGGRAAAVVIDEEGRCDGEVAVLLDADVLGEGAVPMRREGGGWWRL